MRYAAVGLFIVSSLLFTILSPILFAEGIITWNCPSNKTVSCVFAWTFDDPDPTTTCTTQESYVSLVIKETVITGTCPRVITRTWEATDYCGNTSTCSQAVTLLDTNAPVAVCSGINYVPNSGFDSYSSCPDFFSQTAKAYPWYPPTVATPDYFSGCATGTLVHVPTNFAGFQSPLSGECYAGAILFYNTTNLAAATYREYLQVPLIAPLVSGQLYRISFYVSLAESSSWAIAEIGAHVSTNPVIDNSFSTPLAVTPQVVNASTNVLGSTASWMLVDGLFVSAGGETYLTLGNFLSDTATTYTPANTAIYNFAYYYFDNVSLAAVCEPDVSAKTVLCGTPWTFDKPAAVDYCSGTNVTIAIASTLTNSLCPLIVTRTWSLTDPCGNSGVWSQTVTTIDMQSPDVSCGCLQDAALDLLYTNACSGIVPDFSPYTNCFSDACGTVSVTQSPLAGSMVGPGVHSLTVMVSDCSGNVSTCEVPFFVVAPVPVLACPSNLVVLTCSTGAVVQFIVPVSGNAGPVVCTPLSGSSFSLGVTTVTCVATSSCGGVAECSFSVTVKPPKSRWGCWSTQVGIGVLHDTLGGATTALRATGPDSPAIVVYPDPANTTNSGIVLNPGPARAITFTTVLDFTADVGAGFDIVLPVSTANTGGLSLLSFRCSAIRTYEVHVNKRDPDDASGTFRAIAVETNGNLLNSVSYSSMEAPTSVVLVIASQPGVSNCHVTIEIDCIAGGVTIDFPGTIVPSQFSRKGWDGCIYGPDRPVKKPSARVYVLPPQSPSQPPVTELSIYASGLDRFPVEQPLITMLGKRWGDGHVTLMKAYDDGTEEGMEFTAGGPGGGIRTGLGYASNFSFKVLNFDPGGVAGEEQTMRLSGDPGLTNGLTLSENLFSGGVDVYADFSQWGVTSVTLQLWNSGAWVAEANHIPMVPGIPLMNLAAFPQGAGASVDGIVGLFDTNGITVFQGLDCGGGIPCEGTEIHIIAEGAPGMLLPVAFTLLEYTVAEDMDMLIYGLETDPACAVNTPVHAVQASSGSVVSWSGEGYRLQGAESVRGPWFDLGVQSPVTLYAGRPLRVFRLLCD